jgi:hypothetical protein
MSNKLLRIAQQTLFDFSARLLWDFFDPVPALRFEISEYKYV